MREKLALREEAERLADLRRERAEARALREWLEFDMMTEEQRAGWRVEQEVVAWLMADEVTS